jgi:hypothetical protein
MQGTSAGTMGHGEDERQLHDAGVAPQIAIGGQMSGSGSHWRFVLVVKGLAPGTNSSDLGDANV